MGKAEAVAAEPRAHPGTSLPARGSALSASSARRVAAALVLPAILVVGAFLRFWQLNRYGFNSDEAVYAGQAASIARHPELSELFPTFRAHPLLYQATLSIGFLLGYYDLFGRVVSAVVGLATIYVGYRLGTVLYGRTAGWLTAGLLALMPYHVLVSRQVLLDGPMVLFATITLYLLARYALTERPAWLYAAGATMGLTFLAKETAILLVGAVYAFLALSPDVRVRLRDLALAFLAMAVVMSAFPLSTTLAGAPETGGHYLAWQLFRRPNHGQTFYPAEVPPALGYAVVVVAVAGLWLLRRERTWRERLLLSWIVVPAVFFQLWPVKGFQYLLPIAPAVAVLAARTLARIGTGVELTVARRRIPGELAAGAAATLLGLSLLLTTWQRIQPAASGVFLAGSGGVPGGRETGLWIRRAVPAEARFMTIGPSMANILQYYGHRRSFGLSVSPNPLRRNPAYEPIENPDFAIRDNELQYLVWDAFSAARSPFFSQKLLRYADRYNGRVVYTQTAPVRTRAGEVAQKPLIVVYHVRPILASPAGEEDD